MSNITSAGAQVVVCAVITVFIAAIAVFLRFFTRWRILHILGKEDWCILVALAFSFGNTIGMVFQTEYALGHHSVTVSVPQLVSFQKAYYFTTIVYNIGLSFTKIAILLLYMRIFTIPKVQRVIHIQLGIVTVYALWLVLSSTFACTPISLFWNKRQKGTCLSNRIMLFINAALNITSDFMIFLTPLPVIRTLKLPKRQQIGLYLVFTLGFFVCIISITRLYFIHLASSEDPFWDSVGAANFTSIELNIGITCACLTTLKPLISHFFPSLLPSTHTGNSIFPSNSRYHQNTRTNRGFRSTGSSRNLGVETSHREGSEVGIVTTTEDIELESLESGNESHNKIEDGLSHPQPRSRTSGIEILTASKAESWLRISEENPNPNVISVHITAQSSSDRNRFEDESLQTL